MNKKELNSFFSSVYPTEEQRKNVLNNLLSSGNTNTPVRKQGYSIVAVAAVLLITSISVMAATFNWHEKLTEYFNPSEKQMESLQGMLDAPQASETNNGITVNVLQTIADNHGIYVLYEIIGTDRTKIDDTVSWEGSRLNVKYKDGDKVTGAGGYAYNKILSTENNKCTALYVRSGCGEITNQKISFELNGLREFIYNADTDSGAFKKLADCSFNIAWDFEYENLSAEYSINQKLSNNKNTVSQIDISPISMWIMISGEELEFNEDIDIMLTNDEVFRFEKNDINLSYSPLNGGMNYVSLEFNKIINVSDVISINLGDEKIKL